MPVIAILKVMFRCILCLVPLMCVHNHLTRLITRMQSMESHINEKRDLNNGKSSSIYIVETSLTFTNNGNHWDSLA